MPEHVNLWKSLKTIDIGAFLYTSQKKQSASPSPPARQGYPAGFHGFHVKTHGILSTATIFPIEFWIG